MMLGWRRKIARIDGIQDHQVSCTISFMVTSKAKASDEAALQVSKLEMVYDMLKRGILDGTYSPGYRLVLDQLAKEMDVSTLPVREAIRRLEAEGYIEFVRNVGARVARLDPEEYVHTMHVLALVEGYATALAAPHMKRRDINAIRRINDRMGEALNDFNPLAFTQLNREFHFAIYEHCPNKHVRSLVEAQWARLDAIRRSSFVYVPGRAHQSVEEHGKLIYLIHQQGHPDEIEFVGRAHKLQTVYALINGQPQPPIDVTDYQNPTLRIDEAPDLQDDEQLADS